MGLQIQRVSSRKVQVITTLVAAFALVIQPFHAVLLHLPVASALSPSVMATVAPSNMSGWLGVDDNGQGGSLNFVAGPATAPLGNGSAQLKVENSAQGYMLYKPGYSGLKLASLSTLSYKSFVQNGNNLIAPTMQINIDRDVSDSNTAWQGRLVYEPYMNGAVVDGSWQTWNPLEGRWWLSKPGSFGNQCGQSTPCTTNELLALFPNIGVNSGATAGIGFKAGSGWSSFTGNIDAFTINNDVYNFEPIDASKIMFISNAKYVRENTTNDIAAQIVTYANTSQVEFYSNGNESVPMAGIDHRATSAGFREWRLTAPLEAGQHTITGRAMVDGQWHPIAGSSTAFSLDLPTASYVLPNDRANVFRSADNPLRLKIDDEYSQFKDAGFSLYKFNTTTNAFGAYLGMFKVNRAQCDLRQAGNYVLCDATSSDTWTNLAGGTYVVKLTTSTQANNGIRTTMQDYWSKPFTIDANAPVVSGLTIENDIAGVVSDSATIAAVASDDQAVESVNFYVTTPRDDGACTGNGAKLSEYRSMNPESDGKYRANLSTQSLNGNYCVTAVARDAAKSNSQAMHAHITVDNSSPAKPKLLGVYKGHNNNSANLIECGGYTNDTKIRIDWKDNTDDDLAYYWLGTKTNAKHKKVTNKSYYDGNMTPGNNPNYYYTVIAVDKVGNESEISDRCDFVLDTTAPTIDLSQPQNGDIFGKDEQFIVKAHLADNIGFATYRIEVDGVEKTVSEEPQIYSAEGVKLDIFAVFNVNDFTEGEHTIVAWVTDKAGNKSSVETRTIIVDKTAPSVALRLLTSATPYASTPIVLSGNVDTNRLQSFQLFLNENFDTPLGGAVLDMSNGNWQYKLSEGLPQGLHTFYAVATDSAGNEETRTIQVNVGPLAPITPVLPSTAGLSTPFAVPNAFGIIPAPATDDSDEDVLGEQDSNNPSVDQNAKTPAVLATENGWNILGLAWYWWIAILVAAAMIVWRLLVSAKHRADDV